MTRSRALKAHFPLLAILFLALVLRVGYAFLASGTPLAELLLLDSEFYDRQARSLLAGTGWSEGVFFMNPFYPYFLAAVYWLAGPGWAKVVAVQAGLGTASCLLTYLVGAAVWGRRAGLAAAGLLAVQGVVVFYDGSLLTASPILFLNLLGLYLLQRWRAEPRSAWLWTAGFSLGLSALARPLILLWVGFLGVWMLARRQPRAWLHLAVGCALPLLPALAHNWVVGGEFGLTTSSAGMNFYVGNHPEATGIYSQVPFVDSAEPDRERQGFQREAERRLGRTLSPAGASAFWWREGLSFAVEHPGEFLRLCGRKIALFWNGVEAQNNLSYYFAADWVPPLWFLPGWGLLAPLGMAAWAVWARRREPVLELYVLAYLAGCTIFFVSSEYRLPVVPVLALWAGSGLVEGWAALKQGRWGPLAWAAGVFLGFSLLVHWSDPLIERLQSRRVDYHNFSVLYERKGNLERARQMAIRCLSIDPSFAPAQQTLARLDRRREGGTAAGEDSLAAEALRRYGEGDFGGALAHFAELVAMNPKEAKYLNSLGLCYYKMGNLSRADSAYQEALSLNPDYAVAHYNIALLRLAQAAPDQAMVCLRRALALEPGYRPARYKLGEVLAAKGERGAAASIWASLLAETPGDPVLSARLDSLREAQGVRGR